MKCRSQNNFLIGAFVAAIASLGPLGARAADALGPCGVFDSISGHYDLCSEISPEAASKMKWKTTNEERSLNITVDTGMTDKIAERAFSYMKNDAKVKPDIIKEFKYNIRVNQSYSVATVDGKLMLSGRRYVSVSTSLPKSIEKDKVKYRNSSEYYIHRLPGVPATNKGLSDFSFKEISFDGVNLHKKPVQIIPGDIKGFGGEANFAITIGEDNIKIGKENYYHPSTYSDIDAVARSWHFLRKGAWEKTSSLSKLFFKDPSNEEGRIKPEELLGTKIYINFDRSKLLFIRNGAVVLTFEQEGATDVGADGMLNYSSNIYDEVRRMHNMLIFLQTRTGEDVYESIYRPLLVATEELLGYEKAGLTHLHDAVDQKLEAIFTAVFRANKAGLEAEKKVESRKDVAESLIARTRFLHNQVRSSTMTSGNSVILATVGRTALRYVEQIRQSKVLSETVRLESLIVEIHAHVENMETGEGNGDAAITNVDAALKFLDSMKEFNKELIAQPDIAGRLKAQVEGLNLAAVNVKRYIVDRPLASSRRLLAPQPLPPGTGAPTSATPVQVEKQ